MPISRQSGFGIFESLRGSVWSFDSRCELEGNEHLPIVAFKKSQPTQRIVPIKTWETKMCKIGPSKN